MRALALVVVAGCGRVGFDAVPRGDGGAGDGSSDGGVAALCGGAGAVADNFDDGTTAATWYPFVDDASMAIAETGGELVVTLGNNLASPSYAGYIEARSTDLRGRRVFVEVTAVPNGAGEAAFAMIGDNQNNVDVSARGGMLYADERVAGSTSTLGMVPYDAAAQRWWQIREDAGTVYFETSSDGATFTPFATVATPAFAAYAVVELYGGTFSAVTSPGTAHFDNLNGGTPRESWCKASAFSDDFSGTSYLPQWNRSYVTGACTLAETGGAAVVKLSGAGGDYCAFVTGRDFDFTGDAVSTHVTSIPDPSAGGTHSYIEVNLDNTTYFDLLQQQTDLVCVETIATTNQQLCRVPYDPVAHAYWRLRETGGGIAWEVSPDGAAWTTLATKSYALSFTAIHVELGAGADSNTPPPGGVSFDTYNK